jgi:hypothetical protein
MNVLIIKRVFDKLNILIVDTIQSDIIKRLCHWFCDLNYNFYIESKFDIVSLDD